MSGDPPLRSEILARDGAACIYAEKHWIAHATMSVASLTDSVLDLRFTRIETPGFTPPDDHSWEAGVALEHFRFAPNCWMGSPYLGWIIAFAPEVVSAMIDRAQARQDCPSEERAMILRVRLAELIWNDTDEVGS